MHELFSNSQADSNGTNPRDSGVARRWARELGIQPISDGDNVRTSAAVHTSERIGVPAGRTRFDFETGEAVHVDSGTVVTEIPTVDDVSQLGSNIDEQTDKNSLRSLVAYGDVGVTIEVAGGSVPLDPCMWHTFRALEHRSFVIDAGLPTDLFLLPSARSTPPVDPNAVAIHMDRVGPTFTGTPDTFTALGFQTTHTAESNDFGSEVKAGKLHVQNFSERTFVVENTGANDAEVRVLGNATHHGFGRWVDVDPASQPVTVAAGGTEVLTVNGEAWHNMRLEARNVTDLDQIDLEYEFIGVGGS